jgi:hypothetical protein
MGSHHLAQVNASLPREPLDSARLAGFVAALDPVNAAGEAAPGFVWRLQTEDGNATAVRFLDDDRIIVNLTVWSRSRHWATSRSATARTWRCYAGAGSGSCRRSRR